jgi:excisionase family DNA binding protein
MPDIQIRQIFVTAKQLAIMLACSKRTLYRMRSAGKLPSPLRIGGVVRWRLQDVQDWIAAGCPEQS